MATNDNSAGSPPAETFAVIWNGQDETFTDRARILRELSAGHRPRTHWWSDSPKKGVQPGATIYIFKTGKAPEVIGVGTATSAFQPANEIHSPNGTALKAFGFELEVTDLVDHSEGLRRDTLRSFTREVFGDGPPDDWVFMASGLRIAPPFDVVLATAWSWHRGNELYLLPSEAGWTGEDFAEGAATVVSVNRFERSSAARDACIAVHGRRCVVCDFDFDSVYGPELGRGHIEVHHLHPIASSGEARTDPSTDLRPVCPNCHAMLHQPGHLLSPDELRSHLRSHQRDFG